MFRDTMPLIHGMSLDGLNSLNKESLLNKHGLRYSESNPYTHPFIREEKLKPENTMSMLKTSTKNILKKRKIKHKIYASSRVYRVNRKVLKYKPKKQVDNKALLRKHFL